MARTVIIYELNFAIWCFGTVPTLTRLGLNIPLDLLAIAVGATIGFLLINRKLKPLESRAELRFTGMDLVILILAISVWVFLFIYPGPLTLLSALPGVAGAIAAAAPAVWGGYVFALLRWERGHRMDIVSGGRTLRAVPKHKQAVLTKK